MVKIVQENYSQITKITIDNNHLIIISIEEDLQIQEIHKISRKTGILAQTVKLASTE